MNETVAVANVEPFHRASNARADDNSVLFRDFRILRFCVLSEIFIFGILANSFFYFFFAIRHVFTFFWRVSLCLHVMHRRGISSIRLLSRNWSLVLFVFCLGLTIRVTSWQICRDFWF